ncbi:hypothetical protein ACLI1A_16470 [Flavobacterium sp. RHBU_3]|uniref:hypothetical protein n=1 Tax=Flavobacterium sp. RHBU_3 TaxID=3391184 RepID=UPI003984E391
MKKLLCIALLFFLPKGIAQTITPVYGHWKFDSLAEGNSEQDMQKAQAFLGNLSMHFYPDGNYESTVMGKGESGTFKQEGKLLLFTVTETSKTYQYELVSIETETIVINMTKFLVKLRRITSDTTTAVLQNKWKLTSMGGNDADDDDNAVFDAPTVPKGSGLLLDRNGSYTFTLGTIKETGYWDYRVKKDDSKVLILNTNGKVKYWPLVTYTPTELSVVVNTGGQKYVFVPI